MLSQPGKAARGARGQVATGHRRSRKPDLPIGDLTC